MLRSTVSHCGKSKHINVSGRCKFTLDVPVSGLRSKRGVTKKESRLIKEYGEGNKNLLSFGEKGLSITLDIALGDNFSDVYKEFEKKFSSEYIKIYLAKDSFMSKNFFKNTYSKLNNFNKFQKKINPNSTFKSKLSRRLGL